MSRSSAAGPSALLSVLRRRADMLHWLRGFFRDHGYWEVQTPLLSRDVCIDAWIEPFRVPVQHLAGADAEEAFLQTSPEFAMKRLIAAGAEAVFQITPAFRAGETGPLHNPEFMIVEWYRTGDTYHDQMAFTEELTIQFLATASKPVNGLDNTSVGRFTGSSLPQPIPRISYEAAFREALGRDVLTRPTSALRALAAERSITPPPSLAAEDRDGWLNLLLAEAVEPWLADRPAVFVHDYPASQAALARIRTDDPPVAERFELYVHGVEICNGYQELTDAEELRRRIAEQTRLRAAAGLPALPQGSRLLDIMDAGLPECAGVALGLDRLLMVGLGLSTIDEVLAFPFDRA